MGDGALKVRVCVSVFWCTSEASEKKKTKKTKNHFQQI